MEEPRDFGETEEKETGDSEDSEKTFLKEPKSQDWASQVEEEFKESKD